VLIFMRTASSPPLRETTHITAVWRVDANRSLRETTHITAVWRVDAKTSKKRNLLFKTSFRRLALQVLTNCFACALSHHAPPSTTALRTMAHRIKALELARKRTRDISSLLQWKYEWTLSLTLSLAHPPSRSRRA
jgi:hypothetical protein